VRCTASRPCALDIPSVTSYEVYGIRIASDVVLPELAPNSRPCVDARATLLVRLNVERRIEFDPNAIFLRTDDPDGSEWLVCARSIGGYLLRFAGLADFFVNQAGDVIECCGVDDKTSPETLRHLLLDAVVSRVLDLKGFETIHATAVSIDGTACAFLGPTGAGKSTLAANLALAGASLLGDDCLVLSLTDTVLLTPGYAGARLWDDSFDALSVDSSRSEQVADGNRKRRVPELGRGFTSEPQRLKRIYRLVRGEDDDAEQIRTPALEDMSPGESFIELAAASYRFNPTDRVRNLHKFAFFEKLVAMAPIRRLIVPNDFAMLPAVRNLILGDLARESSKL